MKKTTIVLGTTSLLGTVVATTNNYKVSAAEETVQPITANSENLDAKLQSEIKIKEKEMENISHNITTLTKELEKVRNNKIKKVDEVTNIDLKLKEKEKISLELTIKESKKDELSKQLKLSEEDALRKKIELEKVHEQTEEVRNKLFKEISKVTPLTKPEKLKEKIEKHQNLQVKSQNDVAGYEKSIETDTKEKNDATIRISVIDENLKEKNNEKQRLENERNQEETKQHEAIDSKKQEILNAQNDVDTTNRLLENKKLEKETVATKLKNAQDKLNSKIPMIISEEYVLAVKELMKYNGNAPEEVKAHLEEVITKLVGTEEEEEMVQAGANASLRKLVKAIALSDTRTVDIDNLTDEQTEELNEYAADLYRQVRTAFGTYKDDQLVTTKETNKLAKRFANLHVETTKATAGDNATYLDSFNTGHLPQNRTILSTIPVEVGIAKHQSDVNLANGYSYYENIMFLDEEYVNLRSYSSKTMGGLKAHIYDSIAQFLYRDKQSNYGHTVGVVRGGSIRDTKSQLSFAFAHTKGYTTVIFDETVINDMNATLTTVPKMESVIDLTETVDNFSTELNNKEQELKTISDNLTQKQDTLKGLQNELKVLESTSKDLTEKISTLSDEISTLLQEKTNLTLLVNNKTTNITNNQKLVETTNDTILALTKHISELEQEYNNNLEAFNEYDRTVKAMEDAENNYRTLSNDLNTVKGKIDLLKENISSLEKEIILDKNNINDLQEMKDKLVNLLKETEKVKKEFENKNEELESNIGKYKLLSEEISKLQFKLQNLKHIDALIQSKEPLILKEQEKSKHDNIQISTKEKQNNTQQHFSSVTLDLNPKIVKNESEQVYNNEDKNNNQIIEYKKPSKQVTKENQVIKNKLPKTSALFNMFELTTLAIGALLTNKKRK